MGTKKIRKNNFGTLREKDEIECACRILAALKTKKRKWYNLAVYADSHEMPRQEIADRMGSCLNAVMSTLTRIKDWIRKKYKNEFDHINTVDKKVSRLTPFLY